MTEDAFNALTRKLLDNEDGKAWMDALTARSGVPIAFAVADWRTRIARMRAKWGQGALSAG